MCGKRQDGAGVSEGSEGGQGRKGGQGWQGAVVQMCEDHVGVFEGPAPALHEAEQDRVALDHGVATVAVHG